MKLIRNVYISFILIISTVLAQEYTELVNRNETNILLIKLHYVQINQSIAWDGRNEMGNSVASGIYLYRINVKSLENNETFVKTAKLMLMK